jgi:hypothetical protein
MDLMFHERSIAAHFEILMTWLRGGGASSARRLQDLGGQRTG